MFPHRFRWIVVLLSLILIPLGIALRSSFSLQNIIPESTKMGSHSMADTFAKRAVQLREYIFSQPSSTFENNPWAVANAIDDFAETQGRMMIFKKKKLDVANAQLTAQQPAPRTILEFGTFVGKSAVAWGAILRDIYGGNVPEDANVYTFELDPVMVSLSRDLIKLAGLQDVVHVLEGPASESLKKLHSKGKVTSVDMAFFDHWEEFYLPDLQLIEDLKLFRVGSLAIADNTDFPGAPDYLKYVKAGGRGSAGSVKYESLSFETESQQGKPVSFPPLWSLGFDWVLTDSCAECC
jgi:catechol O-methyltransferase